MKKINSRTIKSLQRIFCKSPALHRSRQHAASFSRSARCFSEACSTNPPQVKLVIFDKDGTLTCFHSMWASWCEETASRLENASGSLMEVDDVYNFFNYDKDTRKIGKGNIAEDTHEVIKVDLTEKLISEYGMKDHEARSAVYDSWIPTFEHGEHSVKPLGNVKAIFKDLREKGIKVAVCTSDSRLSTELALESLGISEMVDRVLCGDDKDNTPKPAPENVHLICGELGIKPEEAVIIGDTPSDTVMGRMSKCGKVIGVLSGVCTERDLLEADYIVESIDEAMPIVFGNHDPSSTHSPGSSYKPHQPTSGTPTQHSSRMFSSSALLRPQHVCYGSHRKNYSSATGSQDYTHIIVGAGSAGCVLANRLTEDPRNSVLLLEAGPKDTIMNSMRLLWKIHMPAALTYNLCDDKYNWYYHTTPQKNVNNRVLYWPRGKVWGGSSSLNAMVYIRGHAQDYNRWQQEGAEGWDYDHCLPYFKKAQNHQQGGDTYRGGDGPLNVSRGDVQTPLFQAFIEAGQQAGYPYTADMNGFQQEGIGPMDMTVHKGRRWSAATAYLRPALERSNLHTEVHCMTTKVLFDGKRASGVECVLNKETKQFHATKEVILSGGSINSPQLLMLSGVGNADDLKNLDIPVVQHLPGVGQNLNDHIEVYIQHKCKKPITLYSAQQPLNMLRIGAEWLLKQTGLGATTHLHAGGFIRSKAGIEHPDIQYHFLPSQVIDHGRKNPECHAFQAHVGTMRETSRGWLKLKSKNPYDHPIIEPNLLDTEEDIEGLRACVTLTREIFQQKAFDDLRGEEIKPGKQVQSDSEIDAFVRAACDSSYHPSCTCKMGAESDPMAVVSNEGKVFGLDNLRVVDASVMPSVVSGNLNGPTIMIAEKIADRLKGKDPLHMPNTPVYEPPTLDTQR